MIADLGGRQHGVVALWKLRARRISLDAVRRRAETGHLHRLHQGVFCVGHRAISRRGRWMAAVLSGGPDALLSHRSAAMLWGLVSEGSGTIQVSAPRELGRRPAVRFRLARVPADERSSRAGIPLTGPFRTLLDLAADADPHSLERALQRAEAGRLADAIGLEQLIARYPGRRGVARLRVAVDGLGRGAGITRTVLEDRFLRFVAERGLPQPETNVLVPTAERRYEVDCLWRAQRVIVELDGRAFHDNGHAFIAIASG